MVELHAPRIIISALRGGGGKTLLSLGLCRAFLQKGLSVKPYKKGPDYIDAHWLTLAAKNTCTNVDPYFLEAERLRALFVHAWQEQNANICLLEGNRGLFDGQDIHGSCSTAEVARILQCPVILSLDITKMTRTSAALLQGMAHFEKDVTIAGVILNQVGSARHESIVRACIEQYTDIPILGALPRLKENPLPERHMGLCQNHEQAAEKDLETLGSFVSEHCDMQAIHALACAAPAFTAPPPFWNTTISPKYQGVRIGYIYDEAFWFYYEENLEALRRQGAELVPISLLDNKPWPQDLQGLYLGGGYPEEYLEALSTSTHLATLRAYSEANMPIYAECGGFMILAQAITRQGKTYPMTGIFPVRSEFHARPQGLGYVKGHVHTANAYHPIHQELRGHEFHYSRCVKNQSDISPTVTCINLEKGLGMGMSPPQSSNQDGLFVRQTFASYTHIFAPACPWWAENFVRLAAQFSV